MSPKVETVLKVIESLSPTEQKQLIEALETLDATESIKRVNEQARQGIPLGDIIAQRNPRTIESASDLAADFWPEDETDEEFLAYLREQRQVDK